jgi:FAD dependent oxidoreductase
VLALKLLEMKYHLFDQSINFLQQYQISCMKRDGALKSVWQHNMPGHVSQVHTLPGEVYDVLIVGGGITGISTGLLLQKAAKNCMIAEAQTIGFGTSGGTTAHINILWTARIMK